MDLDTLLSDTGQVDTDPAVLARGRAALDEAARTSTVVVALKRRRTRRLTLVGLVASAAAVVVLVPAVGLDGRPTANADAAQVLLRAGQAAGAQQGDWRSARYWHSVSEHSDGAGPTTRREIWIGRTEPGVLKDGAVDSGVIPLDVALFPTGGSSVDWEGLYALPTEAAALERRLRDGIHGAGPDDDSEMFVIVGDLLRESPAPPALRRALWEVCARIPGVRLVGETTDHAGRPGVAVERNDTRYVLDPDDGRLLEEQSGTPGRIEQKDARGNVIAVQYTGFLATYLEQGPTETAPAATYQAPKKG